MATFELTQTVPINLVAGDILTCAYSGSPVMTILPAGVYTIECYGAQGGGVTEGSDNGGYGGYSKGTITFEEETTTYLYVGGRGQSGGTAGGYNGGGNATSTTSCGGGGGGATDVRIGGVDLAQRIIVAGGGGGASYLYSPKGGISATADGGAGGGASGGSGKVSTKGDGITYVPASGGTSTSGGTGGYVYSKSAVGKNGALGTGGNGGTVSSSLTEAGSGGGGGGYYGGGGGGVTYIASAKIGAVGAGGGSGYISSSFTDTSSSNGLREGNGYIQITVIEIINLSKTSAYCKINNTWKEASAIYCKENGQWKEIETLMLKLNNEWVGGASDSSIIGDIYSIFNLGDTTLSRGTITDCSSGDAGLRGYAISKTYGIEAYSGKALGIKGSDHINLNPYGWKSTGACNIDISGINGPGRLYISAYSIAGGTINDSNVALVVKNNSNIVASYDLTYVTASKMHVIEILNPGTISIELSAYSNQAGNMNGFITHISYQVVN
jgi:hypothetical protein